MYPSRGGVLSLSLGRTLVCILHLPGRATIIATRLSPALGYLCVLGYGAPIVGVRDELFSMFLDLAVHLLQVGNREPGPNVLPQHLTRYRLQLVRGPNHLLALIHAVQVPVVNIVVARCSIRVVLLRACSLPAGGRAIGFLITGLKNLREGRRKAVRLQRHTRVEEQPVDGLELEHAFELGL